MQTKTKHSVVDSKKARIEADTQESNYIFMPGEHNAE